jgi:dipeptidyl aminopeptidase/acylaminoacyl peptidase
MAELRELFEMTTKQMEPDQDSWRKQEERHHRADRRRKFGALAVAAMVAIVAAVGIVWNLGGDDGADDTTPATAGVGTGVGTGVGPETTLVDLRAGTSTPIEGLSLPGDLDVSPDGTRIASSGHKIIVADLDGTNVQRFDSTRGGGVDAPRWSPDGRTIVYQVREPATEKTGNLFALDVASGNVTQLTDLEQISVGLWYMSPSYSPDGGSVLFTSARPCGSCAPSNGEDDQLVWHLWSIPASGGEPTLVLRDAGLGEYSPDGSTIAYTGISGDGEFGGLWIANADGSDRRQLLAGEYFLPRWSPDGTRIAYGDESGSVWVIDVGTGETTRVADRVGWPEWVDDDTLLIPE